MDLWRKHNCSKNNNFKSRKSRRNTILNRIYDQNLIETKLKRRTLKNLISDTCKKTTFSFNNQLYKQCDGVSVGSSLCRRYPVVDKDRDVQKVLMKLNSFHKSLNFSFDSFPDEVHF